MLVSGGPGTFTNCTSRVACFSRSNSLFGGLKESHAEVECPTGPTTIVKVKHNSKPRSSTRRRPTRGGTSPESKPTRVYKYKLQRPIVFGRDIFVAPWRHRTYYYFNITVRRHRRTFRIRVASSCARGATRTSRVLYASRAARTSKEIISKSRQIPRTRCY